MGSSAHLAAHRGTAPEKRLPACDLGWFIGLNFESTRYDWGMLFSETLKTLRRSASGWTADIGDDWSQGRATFGGLVAALGNEAMRQQVSSERPLRGLTITFIGPVVPGTVAIDVRVLRVGKAVTIAQATLLSMESVAATITGVYGSSRETSVVIPHAVAEPARDVEDLTDSSLPPGMRGPSFLQHFGLRWAEGTRPYTSTPLTRSKDLHPPSGNFRFERIACDRVD